jgi:hypothetical protein
MHFNLPKCWLPLPTFNWSAGIILLVFIFYILRKAYLAFLHPAIAEINGTQLQRIAATILALPLIVIGIRGGLQLIPVNESAAVFSSPQNIERSCNQQFVVFGT